MEPKTIDGKVRKFLKARQLKDRAEAIMDKMKPDIMKALEKAPEKTREFGTATLVLSWIDGSPKFDIKAATAKLGERTLAPFWVETAGHNRLLVK